MKIMLSETVTHYHSVEMSDELDIEKILSMANSLKKRCDTGYEAIKFVLQAYKDKFGEAFNYHVTPNACGTEFEELNYEYTIEE